MFTMKAFKYVMGFFFSLTMCSIMTPIFMYRALGALHPGQTLGTIAIFFVVAFVLASVLPMFKLANGFAVKLKAPLGTFKNTLLQCIIWSLFFSVIFTFMGEAWGSIFTGRFSMNNVVMNLPLGFAIGYVVSVAVTPLFVRLSMKICSKFPAPEPNGKSEQAGDK